jgi:hypothetical protein
MSLENNDVMIQKTHTNIKPNYQNMAHHSEPFIAGGRVNRNFISTITEN